LAAGSWFVLAGGGDAALDQGECGGIYGLAEVNA
jgi:hypothetical protein